MALDKNSKPLSVGSKIHLAGVVTKIHHDADIGAIEIELDELGLDGATKGSIICNSNQVENFDGNPVPPPPPPGAKG